MSEDRPLPDGWGMLCPECGNVTSGPKAFAALGSKRIAVCSLECKNRAVARGRLGEAVK
jgi:hypothetical protein